MSRYEKDLIQHYISNISMVTKTMEHKGILLCGSKKGKMDLFAAILNRI